MDWWDDRAAVVGRCPSAGLQVHKAGPHLAMHHPPQVRKGRGIAAVGPCSVLFMQAIAPGDHARPNP